MPELPQGTVTFVFTDIEDSTELLKRLGDEYPEVLSAHRKMVRAAFGAFDGVEMDTQGDAFFYVFPRARDAVAATVEAQRVHAASRWPGGESVRVRIGLHTGEPALHEEGYVGLDVVRAARICTEGRGGQILLSETTRSLVGSGLPEGVSVFPLGQRHLRGIDEPERVYEVAIDGLEVEAEEEPAPKPSAPTPPEPPAPPQEADSNATSRSGSTTSGSGCPLRSRSVFSRSSRGSSERRARCRATRPMWTTSPPGWSRWETRSTPGSGQRSRTRASRRRIHSREWPSASSRCAS